MGKLLLLLAVAANPQFGLSTGSVTTTPSAPPPAPAERCEARRPADVSCQSDADCTAVHTVSCCGTVGYLAINRADAPRFEAVEHRCNPGRRCGCAAGPTILDDGSRLQRGDRVALVCAQNRCMTRLETPRAGPCTAVECGPAPLMPTGICPNGISTFGRGPCSRQSDGRCAWSRLVCP